MARERIIGYEIIRGIAAAMVVAIHCNVYFLSPREGSITWLLVMETTALCVVSVPLFFMVSGAVNLVCEHSISLRDLYIKKMPRLLVPFISWSLIYTTLRILMGKIPFSIESILSIIWEPASYQLWFIYSLIGMYACLPMFNVILSNASKRVSQYVIFIWFVFSVLIPTCTRYIPWFSWSDHMNLLFLEGYWGYFFIGGYLNKYPIKNERIIGGLLFAFGSVVTGVLAIVEWMVSTNYCGFVYRSYMFPSTVCSSIGLFMYLKSTRVLCEFAKKTVLEIASLSMGVYYSHALFISAFGTFIVMLGMGLPFVLILWMSVYLSSLSIIIILKRVPFINKLLV